MVSISRSPFRKGPGVVGTGGSMRIQWHTVSGFAGITALALFTVSTVGLADDNLVVGTWKLKSFVREIAGTGERHNQLGRVLSPG